jgi:hypothetical protein
MPIRINLLAEAQASEELRRKDPVKRALWVGGFVVFLVLLWSSTLQFQVMTSKSNLNGLESKWNSIEKGYEEAVNVRRQYTEVEQKLLALQQLTTNRFLWGTTLDALQKTIVDDVQLVRIKGEQSFTLSDDAKAKPADGKGTPAKTGTATERVTLTLEARDASARPGDQVNKLKEVISKNEHFQNHLQKTNGVMLTSLGPPQLDFTARSSFVIFTLQCYYPEKVRSP